MNIPSALKELSTQPLTHQLLKGILKGYKRPNDKILALKAEGLIEPVKKGLYIAGRSLGSDMEWYIRKGYPLNLDYFLLRARDSGDWKKATINEDEFRKLLSEKIDSVKMDFVKAHISRFIKDPKVLDIWSPQYFQDLSTKLKINVSN